MLIARSPTVFACCTGGKKPMRIARTKRGFPLLRDLTPPDRCIGFFDETEISSGRVGVMGLSHEMLYDQPKSGSPESYRAQIREFALRYFLRVTEMTPPQLASRPPWDWAL